MTTQPAEDRQVATELLAFAGWLVLTAPALEWGGHFVTFALGLLVVAPVLTVLAWVPAGQRLVNRLCANRNPVLLAALAVPAALELTSTVGPSGSPARLAEVAAYVAGVGAVIRLRDRRVVWGVTTTRLFVLVQTVLFTIAIAATHRWIGDVMDVWVFLTHGARALLHGVNPYGITFPNVYSPADVRHFYAPGVVSGGRVTYGFPYMPLSALITVPGYLLGDVRLSGVIAIGALAWVLCAPASSSRSRIYAVLLVVSPSTVYLLVNSWTEASLIAVLGLAVWAMKTGRWTTAAVFLGLFLVSKQYIVVTLPCLWLLRPMVTGRRVAISLGTGGLVTLPFLLADPHAFWRAVVHWQFVQPFRPDSLSVLVYSVNHTGWPSPAVYGVLPLAAGLLVATLFAVKSRPGPAQYATGVGLALLTTVLLSKQAFLNYYFLIGGAFLVAAWAASADAVPPQPIAEDDAHSSFAASHDRRTRRQVRVPDLVGQVRSVATRALADRRFRFVLVGGWNTFFGYAVFTGLTLGLHHRLHYVVVLVIGHLLGVSQGFVLHRRFVYRVRGLVRRDFLRFQLMYAGALGANAALLVAFVSAGLPVLLAQGLIVTMLPVATYFGHLHFSFRRTAHA